MIAEREKTPVEKAREQKRSILRRRAEQAIAKAVETAIDELIKEGAEHYRVWGVNLQVEIKKDARGRDSITSAWVSISDSTR